MASLIIKNEQKAIERNLANYVSCDLDILKDCSLIILALPIEDLLHPSEELILAIPKNAVVTDVGSIKKPIINKWENIHPFFIGSHPMVGTEQRALDQALKVYWITQNGLLPQHQKQILMQ